MDYEDELSGWWNSNKEEKRNICAVCAKASPNAKRNDDEALQCKSLILMNLTGLRNLNISSDLVLLTRSRGLPTMKASSSRTDFSKPMRIPITRRVA